VSQDVGNKYLVDAATPAQALRHVTAGMFSVTPATPKDVARLMDDGVKVENARDAEAAEAATRG
jgi:hypothetical protein